MSSVVFYYTMLENKLMHVWFVDGVGKTSLILALVSEEFPEEVSTYIHFTYDNDSALIATSSLCV